MTMLQYTEAQHLVILTMLQYIETSLRQLPVQFTTVPNSIVQFPALR